MTQTFLKTKENFTCLICGQKVIGNGFTNHCPNCLYSRHVDVHPGDRRSKCLGLMEPVGVKTENGKWKIFYKCQKCGFTHYCKADKDDNVNKIIEISPNLI